MKLWLLRHGEAEPHASRDSERRLTAHGRKEVLQSAARLAGLPLDGILASPYVRAQQTAELVREALGLVEPVGTAPWLTPTTIRARCSVSSTSAASAISCWSATSPWSERWAVCWCMATGVIRCR